MLIALLWSVKLVDSDIGGNVAKGLMGRDAQQVDLTSTVTALVFALGHRLGRHLHRLQHRGVLRDRPDGARTAPRPPAGSGARCDRWAGSTLGALAVTTLYGVLAAALGTRLPQLSTRFVGNHVPVRLWQSIIVFSVIGAVLLYLGLAALKVVPDPFAGLTARWPATPYLVLGVILGAFTIGRPWPMFNRLFLHAARTHNPLMSAGTLALVVIGNLVLMAVLLLVLLTTGFPRWLQAVPSRVANATAFALLAGGAFTLVYWGLRVPARLGVYGWFPTMPWK